MFAFMATPVIHTVNLALCWERARVRVGIKHEALAALCGITATQLSAQLHGKGHPSLWRVLMALSDVDGRRFVWALFDEIAAEGGREVDEDDPLVHVRRAEALLVRQRMAKASLTPHLSDRKSA